MINIESKVYEEPYASFNKLYDRFRDWPLQGWIFRGQCEDWGLKTTLERACENSGLRVDDSQKIEGSMIRDFKRVYDGNDRDRVEKDTLYALSVMRHYGAPTRLLDFTYSKYVGIYFALEYAHDNKPTTDGKKCCAIWCINTTWLNNAARDISPKEEIRNLIDKRQKDKTRENVSFKPLYLDNKFNFVGWENPLGIHQRLHIQQGTFLCPGNVKKSFMENLKKLKGWDRKESMLKVICRMDSNALQKAINEFKRMNISRESLFPGLDGFAQSMRYHLRFYKDTYDERIAFMTTPRD